MSRVELNRRALCGAVALLLLALLFALTGLGAPGQTASVVHAQSAGLSFAPDLFTLPEPLDPGLPEPELADAALPNTWTNIVAEGFEGDFPASNWTRYPVPAAYVWGKRNCEAHSGSYSAMAHGGGATGSAMALHHRVPGQHRAGLADLRTILAPGRDGGRAHVLA